MDDKKPKWMVQGKANRSKVPKSLIQKTTAFDPDRYRISQIYETKNQTPDISSLTKEMEINEHVVDLWIILRKIAKTVVLTTIIVLVIPGIQNGQLALDPYQPAVLMLLNNLIQYSLDAINSGGTNTQIFLGSPLTPVSIYINLGFFVAIVVSLPITVRELINFIKPGLTYTEYQSLKKITGYAAILFIIGLFISYFIILPITLRLLVFAGGEIGGQSILQLYSLSSILSILLWGTLGGGILYASPMILVFLVNIGVLQADQISNRRKEIMMGVFLLAAIITPDPTMISMIVLSLPLVAIIEGVIVWSYKIQFRNIIIKGGIDSYGR